MRPFFRICFLLAITFMVMQCSDPQLIVKEDFVGDWEISEANKDGMLQNDWNGKLIRIEQSDEGKGNYIFENSPDELIWSKKGTWSKSDKDNSFIRDNILPVTFYTKEDELQLTFLIITDIGPCIEPCILPVRGNWIFKLKRNE